MKVEIFLDQQVWNQQTNVYIVGVDSQGRRFKALPVELKFELGTEGIPMDPTMRFHGQMGTGFLQALHEALISVGFKPKDTSGEAMKSHLEDMRKLVFDQSKTILSKF